MRILKCPPLALYLCCGPKKVLFLGQIKPLHIAQGDVIVKSFFQNRRLLPFRKITENSYMINIDYSFRVSHFLFFCGSSFGRMFQNFVYKSKFYGLLWAHKFVSLQSTLNCFKGLACMFNINLVQLFLQISYLLCLN